MEENFQIIDNVIKPNFFDVTAVKTCSNDEGGIAEK